MKTRRHRFRIGSIAVILPTLLLAVIPVAHAEPSSAPPAEAVEPQEEDSPSRPESSMNFNYDDGPVDAAGSPPAGPESTSAYISKDDESADAPATSSAVAANPANCTTTADDPHPSTHVPGTINAVVRQACPVAVERNSTEAKLWEKRWWGYDVIGGPEFSDLTTSKTSRVNVSAPCRTNNIRVTGYGHYLWAGQHIMSQEVSNTQDVAC